MFSGNVHFFDRNPAPHLTKPQTLVHKHLAPLKNNSEHLKHLNTQHTFRFLQLDCMPIARTDKLYPINELSPMRHQRQFIRDSALKMMQSHRAHAQ
ncbi:hypothetical protein SteCoe_15927 [Stentor coeruleus]|uniref:Uncharacterized protein n=1 Tax=Stentor coeruleus TaxID=5963 RepID=A0A1R2C2K9_9CILI|nr:hypothetical protein SteCoe_15927 [Stentor coeruleus]